MKPYSLANVLREGPNVSHRRNADFKAAIVGAAVAALAIWALYAWRAA